MERLFTKREDSIIKKSSSELTLLPFSRIQNNNNNNNLGWTHAEVNKEIPRNTIPRIIHQKYYTKELPDKIKVTRDDLMRKNRGFHYQLYDNDDCREFIRKHFDKHVLWAFDVLKSYINKIDLFRYCVLYIEGGIFVDIMFTSSQNALLDFAESTNFVIDNDNSINCAVPKANAERIVFNVRQKCGFNIGQPEIYNGIIAITAKHEIMKECIDKTVSNIINDTICVQNISSLFGMHRVTGSEMLAKIINNKNNNLLTSTIVNNSTNKLYIVKAPINEGYLYTDNDHKNTYSYNIEDPYFMGNIYNYPVIEWKSTIEIASILPNNNKYNPQPKQTLVVLNNNIYKIKAECPFNNSFIQLIEIKTDNCLMQSLVSEIIPLQYNYHTCINRRFKLVLCNHYRKPLQFTESFIIDNDEPWDVNINNIDFVNNNIIITYSKNNRTIKVIKNLALFLKDLHIFAA